MASPRKDSAELGAPDGRFDEARAELEQSLQEAHEKGIAAEKARLELDGFIDRVKSRDQNVREYGEGHMSDADRRAVEDLRQAVRDAIEAHRRAVERGEKLQQEIRDLDHAVEDGAASMGPKELRAHQRALEAAQGQVDRIQTLVTAQEEELARLAADAGLDALQQKREDALAAVAASEGSQKDVEALDKEIAQAKAAAEKRAEKCARARATLSGLIRKLADAEATRDALDVSTPFFLRGYMLSEAASLGTKYLEAANALVAQYERLWALQTLLKQYGPAGKARDFFPYNFSEMAIPCPALKGFENVPAAHRGQGMVYRGRAPGSKADLDRAVERELARLREVTSLI